MIPCGTLTGENGEQGWRWVNRFNRDEQDEDVPMWRVENTLLDGDAHVVYHKDTVFKLSNGVTLCY